MRHADGYRVVFIVILYFLFDFDERVEHFGNLLLVGSAVAPCGAFYFSRSVFKNGNSETRRYLNESPAHFRNSHSSFLIGTKIKFFHSESIWLVFFCEPGAFIRDSSKPRRKISVLCRFNAVGVKEGFFFSLFSFKYGNPASAVSGVNREDAHEKSIQYRVYRISYLYRIQNTEYGILHEFRYA